MHAVPLPQDCLYGTTHQDSGKNLKEMLPDSLRKMLLAVSQKQLANTWEILYSAAGKQHVPTQHQDTALWPLAVLRAPFVGHSVGPDAGGAYTES